jgi:arsenite methyltransferase
MTKNSSLDINELREQVKDKYKEVATTPDGEFHFHTGRVVAARCGYKEEEYDSLPDNAVESFAGIANPFALRDVQTGETVVDLGSGAGFDCFVAAKKVGPEGRVIGIDMTDEMLDKAQATANEMEMDQVEFKKGFIEELPFKDSEVDVVISNGVINLSPEKHKTFEEIYRVLKPGGYLQFADIANSKPAPQAAVDDIDLWTA